jgi:uracil-DNA glycosylase
VRSGAAGSHSGRGWETFTDEVIRSVNDLPHRVVFVLWGNHARAKRNLISNTLHSVVESAHPSPLSARNGFFGSRPFTRTNALLAEHGLDSIDWDFGRTP